VEGKPRSETQHDGGAHIFTVVTRAIGFLLPGSKHAGNLWEATE
jgi:hypothetical protein